MSMERGSMEGHICPLTLSFAVWISKTISTTICCLLPSLEQLQLPTTSTSSTCYINTDIYITYRESALEPNTSYTPARLRTYTCLAKSAGSDYLLWITTYHQTWVRNVFLPLSSEQENLKFRRPLGPLRRPELNIIFSRSIVMIKNTSNHRSITVLRANHWTFVRRNMPLLKKIRYESGLYEAAIPVTS
jgi:hypothetical protein